MLIFADSEGRGGGTKTCLFFVEASNGCLLFWQILFHCKEIDFLYILIRNVDYFPDVLLGSKYLSHENDSKCDPIFEGLQCVLNLTSY